MPRFVLVATVAEIPAGTGKAVKADGRPIAVFNIGGTFHAIDGTCPHQGGPLGEGFLEGTVVSCPWHFWQFDVVKGHATDFPEASIPKYQVKIEGQDIYVEV